MFESFWKIGDYVSQNTYIYGLVQANDVVRKRPKDGSDSGKQISFKYFLKSGNQTHDVCKKFFLSTFEISNGPLYRCISNKNMSECIERRGTTSSRQLDDSDIVAHINHFPAYQSHYSSELTVKKMYDMYKENCVRDNIEPKTLKYYYHVFNTKFNLYFKPPHQDTCKVCDELELKIKATTDEQIKKKWKRKENYIKERPKLQEIACGKI